MPTHLPQLIISFVSNTLLSLTSARRRRRSRMDHAKVSILSTQRVRPSLQKAEEDEGAGYKRIHLTPWDHMMLPLHYIQKGVLFLKPHHQSTDLIISNLFTSFSQTLDHFFPLP